MLLYEFLSVAGGNQGGFVAYIGDVGAGEARGLACQQLYIYRIVYLDRAQVYAEYFFTFVQVRQVYVYLAVETSGAQQCLVQHVYPVGGGEDDNAAVGAETVHFRQQLVQCVLALVVASHGGCFGTGASHRVDFVDEYDAGCFLLCLAEQVADAGGSYADEHFYEVGACQ